jgi:hypothetical protein
MPSWVSKLPKRARRGWRRAAVPSASSFVLLDNEEQFIRPASPTTFLFVISNQFCNMYFSLVISPSLIIFLQFSKIFH